MPLSSSSESSHSKATTKQGAPPTPSPSASYSPTIDSPKYPSHESQSGLRARSTTSPDGRLSSSFSTRVRARTNPHSKQPPLHLHLPSNAGSASHSPESLSPRAEFPSERPSAPIDIPLRRKPQGQASRPTTPLTARAPQGEYFTSWQKAEPRINESLIPYYSSRAKKPCDNQTPSSVQRGFAHMSPRSESPRYRPSSPLSPKMSTPQPLISNSKKAKVPAQGLNLAGLPKYHPANFPSSDSSPAPPAPLSSRSITSQPRSGRGSDPKQQLLQYQRDIINNTARTSHSLLSSSVGSKPTPPRLNPLGSPSGPMTPLMLENSNDYLAAGSSFLAAGSKEVDGRDFVERLVRQENERRNHPEARSGSVSPALSLSPAVSPAGGRR